jgi:hypothetical protein
LDRFEEVRDEALDRIVHLVALMLSLEIEINDSLVVY